MNSKTKSRRRDVGPATNENGLNRLQIGEAIIRVVKHRGVRDGLGFDTYPTDIRNRLKEFPGGGKLSSDDFRSRLQSAFSDLYTDRHLRAILQDQLKASSSDELPDGAKRQLRDYDQRIDAKLRLVEWIQSNGGGPSGEHLDDIIILYTDIKKEAQAFDDAWRIISEALNTGVLSLAMSDRHDTPDTEDLAAHFHSVSISTSIVILQSLDGLKSIKLSLLSDQFDKWIIGLRDIKGEIPGDEGRIDRAVKALRWLFEELDGKHPTKSQQKDFLRRLKQYPGEELFAEARRRLSEEYPWILKSGRTPNDRSLPSDKEHWDKLMNKYKALEIDSDFPQ